MIPKILHFIWVGDKLPYVDFAIDAFKKVNPDFQIHFANETNIENPTIQEIALLKKFIADYHQNKKLATDSTNVVLRDMFNYEIQFKGSNWLVKQNTHTHDMTIISEILRTYYINKYGGIYLDCDTFPVKPFDDSILQNDFKSYHDDFWSGGNIGYPAIQTHDVENNLFKYGIGRYIRTFIEPNALNGIKYNNDNFYLLRKKFISCQLKYGEKVLPNYNEQDYYIDHYGYNTIK